MSRPRRVVEVLREFSIPLIAGVLTSLVWANLDEVGYRATVHFAPLTLLGFGGEVAHATSLHYLVNEILMAFFFGIATKEITESCLPGGALFPLNRAVNPLLGTLGGVLGPIVVYKAMVALLGAPEIAVGWGVPTATDIALAWLVARAVFGAKHPAVSYLLLLAVADDGIGLAIIAVFYPDPMHPTQPVWLALVALAMGLAWLLKRRGALSPWLYVLVPGILSWLGLAKAHMHPALALVPIVPFMPHAVRDEGLFVESVGPDPVTDTMRRFEHAVKQPVDFGMFGFGLVNAGVAFTSIGPATWAVFAALLVGKTLGVSTLATLGDRLGFPIPEGMTPKELVFAGLTAGLGLTVALFVAGAAFTDPTIQGAAKMGALFSVAAAPLALAGGRLFGLERRST
ncbi:MAG: Na+/H+ antiporter NhaA [Deltaproteobacteria bacterium]|nr:Na+/H+ antiporter NhaA [Deltaproteobacteria bacterium]